MKIAVYCGSTSGADPDFRRAAEELGRWIARSGHSLVYGGGDWGLMGVVASEAHSGGAEVIGVIPTDVGMIREREQAFCTEAIYTADMSSRKGQMLALADACVALPGGIGTLDEMSEAIVLTRLGIYDKPCVFFNRGGFYEPLEQMFLRMESCGFLAAENMTHVCFAETVEEIASFVENWGLSSR